MVKSSVLLSCAFAALVIPGIASADLVFNGGFETDDFTGWILSGNPILGTVDSANPHSGNFAADLVEIGVASRKPDGTLEYDPGASNTMVVIIGDNGTYSQSVRRHLTSYTPKAGSTKQASGFLSLCLDR